ncbi:MAG: hypothetical protein K1X47_06210 [Cyclobacteriaceae bacterium]|nr:hypothetical protein [Cyclobacteriaceae bacterium]
MKNPTRESYSFDSAQRHFHGPLPEGLPIEQAYLHIGMYLGWCIGQQLVSQQFLEDCGGLVYRFTRREISCTILCEALDGELAPSYFNTQGLKFTQDYYTDQRYLTDYRELLAHGLPTLYHVTDSWVNFGRLSGLLSERLAAWKLTQGD